MNDGLWLDATFKAARPTAVGALLRHFRSLDLAEEAFQEACLRALTLWPKNGPPRDPTAWLIFVGRNVAVDHLRKQARLAPLPDNEADISDLGDREDVIAHSLDNASVSDDVLRLLFVCCCEDLPSTQQIALALRIVAGLTVSQIARAFIVSDAAMEQRITRAKRRVAEARIPFETPGPAERAQRLGHVTAIVYLIFNEGYTSDRPQMDERAPLCAEAIRLARLLVRLFPGEPELIGLLSLMLLQDARWPARFNADGLAILLEDQDRSLWLADQTAEGLALLDVALRHRQRGSYQIQAAIAALHARAQSASETDWAQIERLYAALEQVQPSPIVTLNRAVALSKSDGPASALALIEPLGSRLQNYFYFHGVRGSLLSQVGEVKDAQDAYRTAIALANSPSQAAHIRECLDKLEKAH